MYGKKHRSNWNPLGFPFKANYNDHFETPFQAYNDIKPVLDWLSKSLGDEIPVDDNNQKARSSKPGNVPTVNINQISRGTLILYDPYYCNGRTKVFLNNLGYDKVVHEKRDFYVDISRGEVPQHDVLITNPPFSDCHKSQCLNYCFQQLRKAKASERKPFLLLMPIYTSAKQYYRELLSSPNDSIDDVVYLVPTSTYKYDHPESTGKECCPFNSLWFLGLGKDKVDSFQKYWQSISKEVSNRLTLITSIKLLEVKGYISTTNRPNPKKRNLMRKRLTREKLPSELTSIGKIIDEAPPNASIPKKQKIRNNNLNADVKTNEFCIHKDNYVKKRKRRY
jgi:hypothetical protein